MNNQECKARTKITDINTNEPMFYPYSIKVNNMVQVVMVSMMVFGGIFVYFYWRSKKEDCVSRVTFNPNATHALSK